MVLRVSRRKNSQNFFLVFLTKCLSKCSSFTPIPPLPDPLHQAHSESWHIQHSVFSSKCWHIQSFSVLLRHIQPYWDIIKVYLGLFRHIQHPAKPSHIQNFAIFWALANLELEAYLTLFRMGFFGAAHG